MSDAIRDMVAFLIQSPGWKPDRFAVQREKVCKRCHAKKNLEKFAFSDGVCKLCRKELAEQHRKNRRPK